MYSIAANLERVRERIADAAIRSGRSPDSIKLVGVTKTVDFERIKEAVAAGLDILGENYVQEAREKIGQLEKQVSWHLIGRLQTNKAKYAVKLFDVIETVDSMKLAVELNRRAQSLGRVVPVLVQVNLAGEKSKAGLPPSETISFVQRIAELGHLRVRGLMTMPPFFDNPERARPYFRQLRELCRYVDAAGIPGVEMTEISMGMSGDFEAAVEEGATLVRIGTAIFGRRP
ncbi:MAG: YggS family pyridoxal phosphate-dependent enzyme [Syntrophobacteria bacterium]